MSDPRLVRGLLRLYPAAWRARYADELAAVLVASTAGGQPRWRVAADVVAGAADARLHADGSPTPDRIRNAASVAFCAFVVFCLAGSGFQKMSEDPPFRAAGRAHAAIGWSFDIVVVGAFAAALAVVAGSLPMLLAIVRQALAGRRDLRRLLLVPPVAGLAWIGLVFAVTRLGRSPVHSLANVATLVAVVGGAAVAAAASAGALVTAARRAEIPVAVKRAQWLPMIALSAAMVAVTVADLVWGLSLSAQAPGLFHSRNGLLATDLPASWAATLAVLALASAVAVAATARAVRLRMASD
jgi:hypothetical protein